MGIGNRYPDQGWRVSWYTDAESLFDAPLRMQYTDLDRDRAISGARGVCGRYCERRSAWRRTARRRCTISREAESRQCRWNSKFRRRRRADGNAAAGVDAAAGTGRCRPRLPGGGGLVDAGSGESVDDV